MRSFEDKWNRLRSKVEGDIAYLDERAKETGNRDLRLKAQSLQVVIDAMDAFDRVAGPST